MEDSNIQIPQGMRQVLKIQLNGKNNIRAINTYALPAIRYPTGVVHWPKKDMEAVNILICVNRT